MDAINVMCMHYGLMGSLKSSCFGDKFYIYMLMVFQGWTLGNKFKINEVMEFGTQDDIAGFIRSRTILSSVHHVVPSARL